MNRKILISIGLALALMLTVSGTVVAAPAAQVETPPPPIVGTVVSITPGTDPTTGDPIVEVVIEDPITLVQQTLQLSVAYATDLGLVTPDPLTGDPIPNDAAIGEEVSIDPLMVIGGEGGGEEEAQHPVGAVLADFFGVDYDAIMAAHEGEDGEGGAGFGVIAQALWMADKLGDGSSFDDILQAKQDGDYSAFEFEEGTTTPENWGQFRKAVLQGDAHANLGQVMSGHAESGEEESGDTLTTTESGEDTNTHGQQNKGNHGHGHGKGKGKKK